MLTLEEARQVALAKLAIYQEESGHPELELIILDEHTIEKEWGWVFFFESRQYVETGDINWALGGNAPLIVNRFDGSLHPTGTARPTEYYIEKYEKSLRDGDGRSPGSGT